MNGPHVSQRIPETTPKANADLIADNIDMIGGGSSGLLLNDSQTVGAGLRLQQMQAQISSMDN